MLPQDDKMTDEPQPRQDEGQQPTDQRADRVAFMRRWFVSAFLLALLLVLCLVFYLVRYRTMEFFYVLF